MSLDTLSQVQVQVQVQQIIDRLDHQPRRDRLFKYLMRSYRGKLRLNPLIP